MNAATPAEPVADTTPPPVPAVNRSISQTLVAAQLARASCAICSNAANGFSGSPSSDSSA